MPKMRSLNIGIVKDAFGVVLSEGDKCVCISSGYPEKKLVKGTIVQFIPPQPLDEYPRHRGPFVEVKFDKGSRWIITPKEVAKSV